MADDCHTPRHGVLTPVSQARKEGEWVKNLLCVRFCGCLKTALPGRFPVTPCPCPHAQGFCFHIFQTQVTSSSPLDQFLGKGNEMGVTGLGCVHFLGAGVGVCLP